MILQSFGERTLPKICYFCERKHALKNCRDQYGPVGINCFVPSFALGQGCTTINVVVFPDSLGLLWRLLLFLGTGRLSVQSG